MPWQTFDLYRCVVFPLFRHSGIQQLVETAISIISSWCRHHRRVIDIINRYRHFNFCSLTQSATRWLWRTRLRPYISTHHCYHHTGYHSTLSRRYSCSDKSVQTLFRQSMNQIGSCSLEIVSTIT